MPFPFFPHIVLCAVFLLSACQGIQQTHSSGMSNNEKNLLTKADVARALGKQDEAIRYYRRAAEASQGAIRAHLELADIYAKRKQTHAALAIMQAAYALNPMSAEVVNTYAQQLLLANQNEKALEVAVEGLAHYPADVRLLNAAAVAYDRNGQHSKAQPLYHQAMHHATVVIEREYTANNLALSYVATQDYDSAIGLLNKQMPVAKNQPALRQLLALAYGAKGDADKAYEWGMMDLDASQMAENMQFYEQLRNGSIDAGVLFATEAAPRY